jgi:2-polyprenyl-3-methyl-5-hydroxy-6-metoxy-1,4-benzoquinol methylase
MNSSIDDPVQVHEIEWDDRQVSRLWNYYARTPPYSDLYFAKRFGPWLLSESQLPSKQALEVLDFGCGPGFMWEHMRALNFKSRYTGLDFSPESVAATAARARGHPLFRDAVLVRTLPTPLEDASFDVVLLFEVVEHLKSSYLQGTLQETARLLKRGGVVVISTPNEEDLALSRKFCPSCGAIFHEWQHVRSWSAVSLAEAMGEHGFRPVRQVTTNFLAKGWSMGALMTRGIQAAQWLLGRRRAAPHLLAVFQKV